MTLRVEPLSPAREPDFISFFDGPAFADNPDWSQCYCMFFHFRGSNDAWEEQVQARVNRDAKIGSIRSGESQGYLAYDGDSVAGWVNAAPRVSLPKLDAFCPIDDREQVGNIVCFVVGPAHRRKGVGSLLLRAACEGLASQGMTIAEAFPPKPEIADSDAHNFRGPLSMYERAGFTVAGELANHLQVRREI